MQRTLQLSLLLTLLLLGLSTNSPALAQDKTLVWNRYDVTLTVQDNGDMLVEEIQAIEFTSGAFRFGFAAIPLERVVRIDEIQVAEIGPDGSRRAYAPNSTGQYGFTTAVVDTNLEITWYFPPTSNSQHTYLLSYRAIGGLRIYPEGDQVWWKAIPPDHNFPIRSATITVNPPQTFNKNQVMPQAYGAALDGEPAYTDRGGVVFRASNIPADEELEVRVQFPHGAVSAQPPSWQADDDLRRTWGPVVGLVSGALGLLLLVGGPAGVYALWYLRGRDDEAALAPEYLTEPPSDLPAALVGALIDERADMNDIVATIFDLAQRGAIRMEERDNAGSLGLSRDIVLYLQDRQLAKYPHEKRMMAQIFIQRRTERSFRDLRQKFYTAIPDMNSQLYQAVVDEGFFTGNPEVVRKRWLGLSVGGGISALAAAFWLLILLGDFSAAVICPGLGLAATMAALLVASRYMPRKTVAGAEEASKWLAFKTYLENIESFTDLEAVKDKFQQYLPYGVAFGLEKQLINKFTMVEAPAPTWWGPIIMPRQFYGLPGRGGQAESGGPPGPLAGGEGGVPSLSEMSGGLGGSLAEMSKGLGTLLNSASSTLSSSPPAASSSSGGGWSGGGGGWSGGGSFGGGGGGGGSRGFG